MEPAPAGRALRAEGGRLASEGCDRGGVHEARVECRRRRHRAIHSVVHTPSLHSADSGHRNFFFVAADDDDHMSLNVNRGTANASDLRLPHTCYRTDPSIFGRFCHEGDYCIDAVAYSRGLMGGVAHSAQCCDCAGTT